jgi:hypothetical protein
MSIAERLAVDERIELIEDGESVNLYGESKERQQQRTKNPHGEYTVDIYMYAGYMNTRNTQNEGRLNERRGREMKRMQCSIA